MLLNNKLCADAGTVNCPCYLAEYGKCIVCSRLSGSRRCECQWQGVCIYNEYLQNNQCIKERRQSRPCKIQKIKWFDDDLAVMRIGVPRGMAEKAALPGSFVFMKAPGAEHYFDFPVSVLRSYYDESAIELAVKVMGPKSQALLEQDRVELRGIYRNGLLGAEKLMREETSVNGASDGAVKPEAPVPKRVLCLTKGVGIAPAANYIRWAEGRHHIDLIADLDKINREFADYALEGAGVDLLRFGPLPLNMSWAESEKYDVIIICASDYFQQNIYVPEAKKVLSNNRSMCCGEGVCGACICMDGCGKEHRMCKFVRCHN